MFGNGDEVFDGFIVFFINKGGGFYFDFESLEISFGLGLFGNMRLQILSCFIFKRMNLGSWEKGSNMEGLMRRGSFPFDLVIFFDEMNS